MLAIDKLNSLSHGMAKKILKKYPSRDPVHILVASYLIPRNVLTGNQNKAFIEGTKGCLQRLRVIISSFSPFHFLPFFFTPQN